MRIIKKLSTEISNKIAAGEVVERPVSVVKELVENAIDAGASMITVRIESGGISRIHVTDNGCGMGREDAIECFSRHATSKISTQEDLNAIYTLGFRGEALSSISAVSQVDLYTKREQDETGTHIVCANGEIQSCVDEGMPDGTTFIVSNLFYNVPARMKFLKKDSTEASYITDLIERFILSHPEISFRYLNNRKEIYFSAGDKNLTNCIYTVYGKDYAKGVVPVDYKADYIRVSGMTGKGELSRPNRSYQSFFVNKRYIKSPLISRAVEDAYKNRVMVGKYPMTVLNIEIDASMIDINVHPTKQEVKFSNESAIFTAVLHAVENALHSDYKIPTIESPRKKVESAFKADIVKSDAQYELEWEKNRGRWTSAEEVKEYEIKNAVKKEPVKKIEDLPESYKCDVSSEYFEKRRKEILKNDIMGRKEIFGSFLMEEKSVPEEFEIPDSATPFTDAILADMLTDKEQQTEKQPEVEKIVEIPPFKVVGQVFSTYVIVELGDEMRLLDQHAAHERIKYEEIKKELDERGVSAQDLLIPISADLTPTEYEAYNQNVDFLSTLGFEADDFGKNSVVVRTAPAYVDYDEIESLLIELLDQILQNKKEPKQKKAEYAVYTIACKAAIKANHNMTETELEELVKNVFSLGNINTCPHGRPIMISMSKKEIEKEFKRIL